MKCRNINRRGRVCRGELELYYEENGDKIYKCNNCGAIKKFEGVQGGYNVVWTSTDVPEIDPWDRLRWRIHQNGESFTKITREIFSNLWTRFKSFLPLVSRGGDGKLPDVNAGSSDFESKPARESTIAPLIVRAARARKEKEKREG